ncbi:MAG: lipopolysaccharide heptosyltransferase I [Methylotenera sp.]
MKKILIVKTSSLGDVVHCLPVVNDILQHFPDAHIDWVVEEAFADIPRLHPDVNQVMTVAIRRWKKHIFSQNTWAEITAFKNLIKQNQYDAIIDTQGLLKSALITCAANGIKHGYDKNSIRESLASWFYDKTYAISYQQHAVVRNRTLAAFSLCYAAPIDAPDYGISAKNTNNNASGSQAATGLDIGGLQGSYIVALHGTSRDSKLWPVQHWIDLGRQLKNQGLSLALPWANETEQARAQAIQQQAPNSIVLPKLNIHALAGVIAGAKAAIGVDTGLSHLAAALNKPTIAIYTDTNPALTGVLAGTQAQAINLGGVAKIPSVDEVFASLRKIL